MDDLEKRARDLFWALPWSTLRTMGRVDFGVTFARQELEAVNQELTTLKTDLANESNNLAACNAYANKADKEIERGKAAQYKLESDNFNLVCQLSALRRELERLQIMEKK